MGQLFLLFTSFTAAVSLAAPAYNLACDFQFMQLPFAHVKLELLESGALGPVAYVNMNGAAQEVDTRPLPLRAGEIARAYLNHDREGEAIEIAVWQDGRSLLTNHTLPIGKEMPGACKRAGR